MDWFCYADLHAAYLAVQQAHADRDAALAQAAAAQEKMQALKMKLDSALTQNQLLETKVIAATQCFDLIFLTSQCDLKVQRSQLKDNDDLLQDRDSTAVNAFLS